MPTEHSTPTSPTPSRLPTIGERIDTLRQDLESVFTELETIHDVVVTVHKGLLEQNVEQDGDFANVLQRCGSNKLFEQLLELTTIIEELGGTTNLSDDDKIDAEVAAVLGGAEGSDDE